MVIIYSRDSLRIFISNYVRLCAGGGTTVEATEACGNTAALEVIYKSTETAVGSIDFVIVGLIADVIYCMYVQTLLRVLNFDIKMLSKFNF